MAAMKAMRLEVAMRLQAAIAVLAKEGKDFERFEFRLVEVQGNLHRSVESLNQVLPKNPGALAKKPWCRVRPAQGLGNAFARVGLPRLEEIIEVPSSYMLRATSIFLQILKHYACAMFAEDKL